MKKDGVLFWQYFFMLAVATVVVFFPVLRAEFLNWDDQTHLTKNTAVLNFDLVQMFKENVHDTYIPLTSLSFALEKAVFGLNPFIFHLDNLLLHVAVSGLLMFFFFRLGASRLASFLGALLFAVHPMHVESVAWVTERKDVLYALFYVLALGQWLTFLKERNKKDLALTLVWACFSLLAKPMALSLPLVLLFLEWWHGGNIRCVRFKFYVPFVILSCALGWVTYMHHVRNPVADFSVSLLIWIWTLGFYIWKFFLPFIFHPLYALPTPVGLFEGPYLASLMGVGVLAVILGRVALKHMDRWLLWAAGFFFLSIFFVLRFDAHDVHVVADRFMYLPSAGICLWLGVKAEGLWKRFGRPMVFLLAAIFILLGFRTFTYASVWNNSISLWSYVIHYYPKQEIAYNNRSVVYGDMRRYDLAVKDNTTVLSFPSNKALAFYNRGVSFKDWAQYVLKEKKVTDAEKLFRLAKADFDAAVDLDPVFAKTYNHRGMVRHYLKDDAGAVDDLTLAIERNPVYGEAYNNRGNLRAGLGQLDLALSDYRRVIELGSFKAEAYSNIGIIYARRGLSDLAMQSFDQAIVENPRHGEAYFNRSVIRFQKGDRKGALNDAERARNLGIAVDAQYFRLITTKP